MGWNHGNRRLLLGTGIIASLAAWWMTRMTRQTVHALQAALAAADQKQEGHYRQTEALLSLFALPPFRDGLQAPLPAMRAWAISPDFANLIVAQISALQPRTIVEVGSGVSTIISGYCLKHQGMGRVIAIDHDPVFARITEENIKAHGLEAYVRVICAPLKPLMLNGATWQWYDTEALENISDVDLLIVDGPPQMYNPTPQVRYPALPYFLNDLSPNAHILMDDADRTDERTIAERWQHEFPVEQVRRYETERGALLLRVKAMR